MKNNHKIWGDFIFLSIIITSGFLLAPVIDIGYSKLFFDCIQRKFAYADSPWMYLAFKIISYSAKGLTTAMVCWLAYAYICKHRTEQMHALYEKTLYVAIASICNFSAAICLKHIFQRARPFNIVCFGGNDDFSPIFEIGQCTCNCSFVSNHAMIGFTLYSVAFLFNKDAKKFTLLFMFATLMGLGFGQLRIMAGKHFLSDIIFAGLLAFAISGITYHISCRFLPQIQPRSNNH